MAAKLKALNDFFNTKKMIIFSGVFLLASLVLYLNEFMGFLGDFEVIIDPAWVPVIVCGYPLMYLAITRIIHNKGVSKISSALLICIAMFACVALSFLPDSHEGMFAAGEVAWIMAIGAYLEERALKKTKKGIEALLKLAPQQGRRIKKMPDGKIKEEMVDAKELLVGDVIRILPGEAFAADGVILVGDTSVDQSIMTGESLPVDKTVGDTVATGTLNRFGSVDIKVTKAYKDSSLQKMIQLVQEAENNKAPMQKLVDKWASWLVPIACLLAIGTYFFTLFFVSGIDPDNLQLEAITRGVTVLVVFCPCALALATPTSVVAAIGQATKYGVLIKSGEALEVMGNIDTIAFDKTGTLTHGKLVVSDIAAFGIGEDELLMLAASAENRSEHPLGKAIVTYAKNEKGIELTETKDFAMTIGKGVAASVNGRKIICGNEKLITGDYGVNIDNEPMKVIDTLRGQGKAVIIIADDKKTLGVIALSDTLKKESAQAIRMLKSAGITKTVLLTGDNEKTARFIADQVGITDVCASLLPEGKVEAIAGFLKDNRLICMVGDGVNDAPALKTASIGIAMGSMGSDIAIDAADIALMGDDISKISYIKRLSNATLKTIKFNITLSMIINAFAIVFSALGLLNPMTGALVHNIGSVLIVLNAARLYDRKYDDMPVKLSAADAKSLKREGTLAA